MLELHQFTYIWDQVANQPSVSHLGIYAIFISSLSEELQKENMRNNDKTWYPSDDERKPLSRRRNQPRPAAGRKSIQPGSVVILLSGAHRGRRAVVLKNLPSGNILVTGPYAINGVPLKRVNPAYVISTSTRVPLDGVAANIDETHFKRSS
jgi:large subunit ribosomal protein L6e